MSLTEHAYLATRVAAMSERLLRPDQFSALLAGKETGEPSWLSDIVGGAELPEEPLAVERALNHALLLDFAVIRRPLHGALLDLFNFWMRRFELMNLKALVRGKLNQVSEKEIAEELYDLPLFGDLPLDELLATDSVPELLRRVERTRYGEIAQRARRSFEEKGDPLVLDATLDQRFYTSLLKLLPTLPDTDRKPLTRLVRRVVDHQNLIWLLRYRFAYGLSPSETYYLLIPHGAELDQERLLKLVACEDREAVRSELPEALAVLMAESANTLDLELRLEERLMQLAHQLLHQSESIPARAFAYLLARECELHCLRCVLQGRRLGLAPELVGEILQHFQPRLH